MLKLINKLENGKDKIIGRVKEVTGKMTDSEGLEMKGKLQSMKLDVGNKAEDMKEDILDKANHFIDKMNKNQGDSK